MGQRSGRVRRGRGGGGAHLTPCSSSSSSRSSMSRGTHSRVVLLVLLTMILGLGSQGAALEGYRRGGEGGQRGGAWSTHIKEDIIMSPSSSGGDKDAAAAVGGDDLPPATLTAADWLSGLGDAEIVVPQRLDARGEPLPHQGAGHEQLFRSRTKRSVSEQQDTTLYYRLTAFGRRFDLELSPEEGFISPHLVVHHRAGEQVWQEKAEDLSVGKGCFHTGTVLGDPGSTAAIAVCDNMMGVFRAGADHYVIEPHPNHTDVTSQRLHVIYRHRPDVKRRATNTSACGVKGDYKHERWKEGPGPGSGGDRLKTNLSDPLSTSERDRLQSNVSDSFSSSSDHRRRRRSVSYERFVEVMVVADKKMADYHGKNIHHYILALMSIVQAIYRDPSIGNSINIIVVRIEILHNETAGPKISQNAAATLRHFCRWQHSENYAEDHPLRHDTSVLITRENLCRSQTECDTMGLAELGTMCDSPRSCAINEDNGLSAAFTIAHELGHLFSMPHDDDSKCRAFMDKPAMFHVMAPTLDYLTDPWTWSECSTKMLTNFLDEGYGECLLDRPQLQVKWENTRAAGEEFNANKQCEFVFGPGSIICPYMPACARLWCIAGSNSDIPQLGKKGCRTQHMPWADGTKCGPGKWCQRGKCAQKWHMTKVDGGWSKWRSYGSCSRTCGGGIKKAVRECNNPRPRNNGEFCLGKRVKYKSCNTQDCPPIRETFREKQCSEFDGRHFNINGLPPSVRWVPKYAGIQLKDQCKLFCRVSLSSAFYLLKDKVLDGTKCAPDTSDICVNGHCHKAGCDNKLNSRTRRDECGVCGGDNSSCKQITGHYNDSELVTITNLGTGGQSQDITASVHCTCQDFDNPVSRDSPILQWYIGYNHVIRIPRGATNIDIQQGVANGQLLHNSVQDDNYLALRNSTNTFILNGNFVITAFHKDIHLKGSKLEYSGSNNAIERINGTQMIHEDLQVLVLSVGKVQPPNIVYKYTISMPGRIIVEWSRSEGPMGSCSHICRGQMIRSVVCVRKEDRRQVSDQRCEAENLPKPRHQVRACNTHCDLRWHMVDQSECSSHCGEGTVTRRYKCRIRMLNHNIYTDNKHCVRKFGNPRRSGPCDGKCERTHWEYQPWGECSKTCGGGVRHREVVCMDHMGHRYNRQHCNQSALVLSQSCNEEPCPQWQHEGWTGCSVTCGRGQQYRQVWCKKGDKAAAEELCQPQRKPKSSKVCSLEPCPSWFKGQWGLCSVTCGLGIQQRDVRCQQQIKSQHDPTGNQVLNVEDDKCDAVHRPDLTRQCFYPPCMVPTTAPPPTTTEPPLSPLAHSPPAPVAAALSRTQWRTGSWTECSASCGQGEKERYVSCRDYEGKIAEEAECAHLPKPASKETCIHRYCGRWRTGEWTSCSESCGSGLERRYVTCMVLDDLHEQLPISECDIDVKPAEERACNQQLCTQPQRLDIVSISSNRVTGTAHWRAGPWGGCSSTCEGGWQRRQVVCQDETGASELCGSQGKPSELQFCNSGPCPRWNYGDWGPCSVTCGEGTQDRVTSCQLRNGNTLMDSSCDILNRPVSTQHCVMPRCSDQRGVWSKGPWSSCSVTCGHGHRTRRVICVDADRVPVPEEQCRHRKPKEQRRCRQGRCPKWMALPWARCSVTCGGGIQKREIRCVGKGRRSLAHDACANNTKPELTQPCSKGGCGRYHWKSRPWAQCSVTCGRGYKERAVLCLDKETGQKVAEPNCSPGIRPKTKKRCSDNPCPFRWIASDWEECSQSCGMGIQKRRVECRSVTREGWVTSRQMTDCDPEIRPESQRHCNYGNCASKYRWKAERWGRCSQTCGPGKARRDILCIDEDGALHPQRYCREQMPVKAKACELRPCYAKTCLELKRLTTVRRDGEYSLIINNKLISIYCSGMHSPHPVEYLSLGSGQNNNYAQVFDKRLRRPQTCPRNGTLDGGCGALCKRVPYAQAGHTIFSKVRLNVTTLTVIGDDFKYSSNRGGKQTKYASAGDCFSARRCPQGRFKVDLTDTGLRVSKNSQWRSRGANAVEQITFSKDGQVVEGVCGGYCGHCLPVRALQLEVSP